MFLSGIRGIIDPSRPRAAAMVGWSLALHGGLSAISYWLTKQAYRSTTGILFEVLTGYSPGQFVARHPSVALITSAYLQREVWQEIGDEKTGAVRFAGAGGMSGGSMPVLSELPRREPWMEDVLNSIPRPW
jgi:hypothetical protein